MLYEIITHVSRREQEPTAYKNLLPACTHRYHACIPRMTDWQWQWEWITIIIKNNDGINSKQIKHTSTNRTSSTNPIQCRVARLLDFLWSPSQHANALDTTQDQAICATTMKLLVPLETTEMLSPITGTAWNSHIANKQWAHRHQGKKNNIVAVVERKHQWWVYSWTFRPFSCSQTLLIFVQRFELLLLKFHGREMGGAIAYAHPEQAIAIPRFYSPG